MSFFTGSNAFCDAGIASLEFLYWFISAIPDSSFVMPGGQEECRLTTGLSLHPTSLTNGRNRTMDIIAMTEVTIWADEKQQAKV
jgi:hypothetical protein